MGTYGAWLAQNSGLRKSRFRLGFPYQDSAHLQYELPPPSFRSVQRAFAASYTRFSIRDEGPCLPEASRSQEAFGQRGSLGFRGPAWMSSMVRDGSGVLSFLLFQRGFQEFSCVGWGLSPMSDVCFAFRKFVALYVAHLQQTCPRPLSPLDSSKSPPPGIMNESIILSIRDDNSTLHSSASQARVFLTTCTPRTASSVSSGCNETLLRRACLCKHADAP